MIKNWLSRYTLSYPRALVYMLQASEYNVADYLSWYHATKSFTAIEKRKKLVKTAKAVLLLIITWAIIFCLLGVAILPLLIYTSPIKYLGFFLIILLSPYILAYGIIIPLLLIKIIIQWPIEYLMNNETKQILKTNRAIRIGVAGSFGKTTMREILKTILAEGKKVAAPPHSYNTAAGINQFVKTLTGDEDFLIFELGEYYPGDIKQLCDIINPDIGIITGINEAHLHRFKSLQRTVATIYELADHLKDKPVYVNGESELALKNIRAGHITYSRDGIGNYKIIDQKTSLSGTSFSIIKENVKIELKSSLLGLHQIGPLAVAAKIALELGLTTDQIQSGIAKTKPFDHRLEPKIDAAGVVTLDDGYNGNPDGVKAVIDFLASLDNCRRFYVTPGLVEIGSKTQEIHREIGKELAMARIEKIILIKNSVTPYIQEGLKGERYQGDVLWYNDGPSAFAALPQLTVSGDVVLIQNDWPDQYK